MSLLGSKGLKEIVFNTQGNLPGFFYWMLMSKNKERQICKAVLHVNRQ